MTGEINWTAGAHFLTIHNVHYQLSLMAQIRDAIKMDQFSEFVQDFFRVLYHGETAAIPKVGGGCFTNSWNQYLGRISDCKPRIAL